MSEFERLVENALGHSLPVPREGETYSGFYRRAMDMLAPRVAAAIRAASWYAVSPQETSPARCAAALAALRGDP